MLSKLDPEDAAKVKAATEAYLAHLPNGQAKDQGIKLGLDTAARVLELRTHDGDDVQDAYRPVTQPGVYTETMPVYGWKFATMKPFAMHSPSQFRPAPPIALNSEEWARNYNEMKAIGEKVSRKRTRRQTDDARFWLMVDPGSNQPLARQTAILKNMSTIDSAHFMALVTIAQMDALIAVFDAKYH